MAACPQCGQVMMDIKTMRLALRQTRAAAGRPKGFDKPNRYSKASLA